MPENKLIAIVDDDAPLLAALGNLARSVGYRVALFESAEALLAVTDVVAADLVLTDFRLGGANGAELIRALRGRGCAAPAIVMTAEAYDEVSGIAMPAGALAVLSKPFDEDDLLESVEAALHGRDVPPSTRRPR